MQVEKSLSNTSADTTETRIRHFISKKFKITFGGQIGGETDFFEEGLIDSYGFLELINFLESEFKIRFEDEELFAGQLNTIENITSTVNKKLKG